MAELLALQSHSVQNCNSFTQKQAFVLHFTFFIIFLMCVTSSSDLNPAEKITQRSDALIHQLGCFNLHNIMKTLFFLCPLPGVKPICKCKTFLFPI